MESAQPLYASKNIAFHFHAPESLIGSGDSQRLVQLLYILLDNAYKYTPANERVALLLSRAGSDLFIVLEDTGIGIKPEDQERIFERFYRADKSRSRQAGGHGLGLAIADWIVKIHQGTIEVTSEQEKGSTFIVKLPFFQDRV